MTTTHLPPNWERRLLAVLGAPATAENVRLLTAWAAAEGGTSKWNPLNTTYGPLPYGESWPLAGNTSGVQNYWKPTGGICATAMTLIDGTYVGILGALQHGTLTAEQIVEQNRGAFHTWGTDPDSVLRALA